ncbi:MAG: hypothetical protein ACFFB8_16675, partial [Promethearchaeota archaeon]
DAIGSHYLVYLDDMLKIEIVEEDHLSAGQIGFMTWTDNATSYFDDLRIRLLVPIEPVLKGGVEEKYEFTITSISCGESIPSNEESVVHCMITASNGVKNATLYCGYDFPYNQYNFIGKKMNDNIWEFIIPLQGDSNEDIILKFYILAYDNGDPPESEINDNGGLHFSIHIIDEDTIGPEISAVSYPSSVSINDQINVICTIFDPSNVNVMLYYGYDPPYDQNNVEGSYFGENNWEFNIPTQGDENKGKSLYFFIIASDEDNSPATTIDDNGGAYYNIEISDTDNETPVIVISGYFSEWIIISLFLGVIFIFLIRFARKSNSSLKVSH